MPLSKSCIAETIGTFFLVFAGTGAIVIDQASGGPITHLGVALTFGLIVMAMIYALGDVSGAHINPAVTLAFWSAGRFPGAHVAAYIGAQCVGAVAASVTLAVMFPDSATLLGATLPTGSATQSFVLEIVLTTMLMFVVINVATGAKEKGIMAGAAIGSTVALAALFAGPISGASMNPARSLGPALVAGHLDSLWIYLTAPVLGAQLAVLGCRCIKEQGCCGRTVTQGDAPV